MIKYIKSLKYNNNKKGADKYVLSIGKKERWEIKDLVKIPGIWWNVRMFTERKISSYLLVGILILIFLFIIYYILKKWRVT